MSAHEGPRLHELEERARRLGRTIAAEMPDGVGFALHLFTLGDGGWSSFVANVDRQDHIRAMREFIHKAEEMPDADTP